MCRYYLLGRVGVRVRWEVMIGMWEGVVGWVGKGLCGEVEGGVGI